MKKLENYLNKCTKHLFYNEERKHYFKVSRKEDGNFLVTFYDEDFNFNSEKEIDLQKWSRVSPKGKEYIDPELKNWVLFYRYVDYKGEKKVTRCVRQNKHILAKMNKESV